MSELLDETQWGNEEGRIRRRNNQGMTKLGENGEKICGAR